jgi:hypothetical protein
VIGNGQCGWWRWQYGWYWSIYFCFTLAILTCAFATWDLMWLMPICLLKFVYGFTGIGLGLQSLVDKFKLLWTAMLLEFKVIFETSLIYQLCLF